MRRMLKINTIKLRRAVLTVFSMTSFALFIDYSVYIFFIRNVIQEMPFGLNV